MFDKETIIILEKLLKSDFMHGNEKEIEFENNEFIFILTKKENK